VLYPRRTEPLASRPGRWYACHIASGGRLQRPKASERLELDVELRLSSLWRDAADWRAWDDATLWAYLRLAYGTGYLDALTESTRGKLCLDHGLRVPQRASVKRCDGVS
jgi:hypothetical protein